MAKALGIESFDLRTENQFNLASPDLYIVARADIGDVLLACIFF